MTNWIAYNFFQPMLSWTDCPVPISHDKKHQIYGEVGQLWTYAQLNWLSSTYAQWYRSNYSKYQ
jgi:hypothetical protein